MVFLGCLESLVYYKRLLVKVLQDANDDEVTLEERDALNTTCLDMLEQLKKVDPMRKARYEDLGEGETSEANTGRT